jgi:hypothetical protein
MGGAPSGSGGTTGTGVAAGFPPASSLPSIAALPDPFTFSNGRRLTGTAEWPARRQELATMIQHYEYGALPPAPSSVSGQLAGNMLTVSVSANDRSASFTATVALPGGAGPFPAFIQISGGRPVSNAASFTDRGYAFIFLDTNLIAADNAGTHTSGAVFYTLYPDAEAGVLMAWAWGVHRIVDALASIAQIDATKLAVNGFSRWGKAALIAGAFDERIALTIPSSSGLTGIGQFRFFYEDPGNPDTRNERIDNALGYAPYWYTPRLGQFVSLVTRLPFDQHEVMALVAPRALLATGGKYDYWTNPRGCLVSWIAAKKVYDSLGASNKIGFAWDDTAHQLTAKHLDYMLEFADVLWKGAAATRDFHAQPTEFADEPSAHPWTAP